MGKQKMIQIKNFRAKFTEPDDEGHFTGYASVFELEDLDGDIIKPGAFKKTLSEKKRFPFLWQHMVQETIGWVEMEEDEKGLKITNGKLILDVQRAAEARALMKEQAVNGLSIGFELVKWENVDEGRGRIITEIKLWEVSAVTFPAQPAAVIETVKTLDISKLSTDDDIGDVEGKDMNQDNLDKDFDKEPPEFSSTEPPEPEKTTRDTEPEKTTQNGKIDVPLKDNEKEKEKMEKEELERKELKEKIEGLEKQILEMKAAGFKGLDQKDEDAKKYEAKFWEWAKTGKEPPELKTDYYPINTTAAQGGYLIPQKLFGKVVEKVAQYSPIRQYAFVNTVAGDIDVVKENAGIDVAWPGETGTRTEGITSGSLLASKKIIQYPQTALVLVSRKMLASDTIVNLEDFIAGLVGRYVAKSEGTKFVNGTGSNEPFGLLATDTNPILTRVTLGTHDTLTFDDVKKAYYNVPSYARSRGVWCTNDAWMLFLSKIKSAVTAGATPVENIKWNSYAFGDVIGPEPNTILGRPVISCPDMTSAISTGSEDLMIFGDLQGYWITDNPYVVVQRLDELYAASGKVGFLFEFLKGGYPVDPQGLRVLANTAS